MTQRGFLKDWYQYIILKSNWQYGPYTNSELYRTLIIYFMRDEVEMRCQNDAQWCWKVSDQRIWLSDKISFGLKKIMFLLHILLFALTRLSKSVQMTGMSKKISTSLDAENTGRWLSMLPKAKSQPKWTVDRERSQLWTFELKQPPPSSALLVRNYWAAYGQGKQEGSGQFGVNIFRLFMD